MKITDALAKAWGIDPLDSTKKLRVDRQKTAQGVNYYAMLVTDTYLGPCDEAGMPRKHKPRGLRTTPRTVARAKNGGPNAGKLTTRRHKPGQSIT